MKTNYWALTAIALLFVAISYATDTPKMEITFPEVDKAELTFESAIEVPVELTICKQNGDIVYYWKGEKPVAELNKVIESSDLGYGSFNVCLNFGGQSINRKLSITRKATTVGPSIQRMEPYFNFEDDNLTLSFLNLAQKNVYIDIYKGYQYLAGYKLGNSMDIQSSFDFSSLEDGEYKVVVSEHFKDHYYTVQK